MGNDSTKQAPRQLVKDPRSVDLFAHLWRGGAYAYWWILPGRRSFWFRVREEQGRPLPSKDGANLYFSVHPSAEIPATNAQGEKRRPSAVRSQISTIAALNCLFAEYDAKDHGNDPAAALAHVEGLSPAPSVVVASGGGYHVYWFLADPWLLDTEEERARAVALQAAWVGHMGGDEGAKDLARVLRVPGTLNQKYDPPRRVEIVTWEPKRLYTVDQLAGAIPEPEPVTTAPTADVPRKAQPVTGDRAQRWAAGALEKELDRLAKTTAGGRNDQLNKSAFALGQIVGGGYLNETDTADQLATVAAAIGLSDGEASKTIASGIAAGKKEPRHPEERPQGLTPSIRGYKALQARNNGVEVPSVPQAPTGGDVVEMIAQLATVGDDSGAVETWAAAHVEEAAQLPEPDRLRLQVAMRNAGARALFVDRDWPKAVRAEAKKQRRRTVGPQGEQPERYRVIQSQICRANQETDPATGETITTYRPLANFTAQIVADVLEDDGEEVTRAIAIAGELNTGEKLPEITIPAKDFEAMKWPVEEWGGRISIEPGRGTKDTLRHAIQWLSADELEARHVYTHTGWREIDGRRVFLHAGGALGADGVTVKLPGNLEGYRLPSGPSDDRAGDMRASIALLDLGPARVTVPIWAGMYLPPLAELIPPSFVLWPEGESGTFKTSTAAVMLNHYGASFSPHNMPAGWESTANSLEKLAFHAKDLPLVIDDFRPSTNRYESQKMMDAATRIIRAAGNRQGRGRLDADSNFRRTFSPRGVVMATSERGALGVSTNARLLTVEINPGDIDAGKLTQAQRNAHRLPYAMAGYLLHLAEIWEDLKTTIPEALITVRDMAAKSTGHKRLPGVVAGLYVAFDVAMSYAVLVGAITEDERDQRNAQAYLALAQLAEEQAEIVAAHDPALQFVEILITLLRARDIRIESDGKPGSQSLGTITTSAPRVGWHDGTNVYLLPTAYHQVSRYAGAQGWAFPSDERGLNKELERKGFLADTGNNRNKTQRQDPTTKERKRVIVMSLERLRAEAERMGITADDLTAPVEKEGRP